MKNLERKQNLLTQLFSNQITQDELQLKCIKWLTEPECWQEITPKLYPTITKQWQEYLDLPFERQSSLPPEYFKQPGIYEYLTGIRIVDSYNFGMFTYLTDIKKYIPDNAENLSLNMKLEAKIFEFKKWVKRFSPKFFKNYTTD